MANPISKSEGFVRTPDRFPHDAFAADTGGRVRPHSGLDTTPTVANARARAVIGGTVTRVGRTVPAGNYVEILGDDGWLWLSIHLARQGVGSGARVEEDDVIGIVGNTGGSGALTGGSKLAVHSHVSRCRDRAAADRVLNGTVRARLKGETREQWATAHGFSDPWPTIRDGKASSDTPATSGDNEEDWLMALTDQQQGELYAWVKGLAFGGFPKRAAVEPDSALHDLAEVRDALLRPDQNGFRPLDVIKSHTVGAYTAIAQQAKAQGVQLDEGEIAKALLDQGLPGAIVTEIVKR